MEIYMEFTKYMVAILVIYIYIAQYNQNIRKKNVFTSDSARREWCWFSVSWGEKGFCFFFLILLSNL